MSTESSTTVTMTGTEYVNKFDYNNLKNREYSAQDYAVDIELQKGPMEKRRCTDCLCFLIFNAFLVGMGWMTILGYINGNGGQMLAPIDFDSNFCDYGIVQGYPVLVVPAYLNLPPG